MIRITVFKDSFDTVHGFQISGHAGFAEAGEDIVCSAISILAENTINAIETFTHDPVEHEAVNEEEGFLSFRLKEVSKESKLLFDTMCLGFDSIQSSYGQFVEIRFKED